MTHRTSKSAKDYAAIMAELEVQLTKLDRIGAHLAAAHVDAAITQIRRDTATLQPTA